MAEDECRMAKECLVDKEFQDAIVRHALKNQGDAVVLEGLVFRDGTHAPCRYGEHGDIIIDASKELGRTHRYYDHSNVMYAHGIVRITGTWKRLVFDSFYPPTYEQAETMKGIIAKSGLADEQIEIDFPPLNREQKYKICKQMGLDVRGVTFL